jgi:hypothetical protein
MKKTEIKNGLLTKLASRLKPRGFVLIRRMDWFVRKGPSSLIYRLDFYGGYEKDKGYTVSPSVAIRIEEVEKIFHMVSGFEPKYQKDSPTIWPTIKDLQGAKDGYEYELNSFEDIYPLAKTLFEIFEDIALPFLEKYSSITELDKLLNSNPENGGSIFNTTYKRFYRDLIVARLAERENYKQIVEIYREHLSRIDIRYLRDFEKLVKILETI